MQPEKTTQGRNQPPNLYCTTCGTIFPRPKTLTKGSILIEIFGWLFFLIPGILYSFWRLSSRQKVCPVCNSPSIIPANSPRAKEQLSPS
jgi:hypothetical protein